MKVYVVQYWDDGDLVVSKVFFEEKNAKEYCKDRHSTFYEEMKVEDKEN